MARSESTKNPEGKHTAWATAWPGSVAPFAIGVLNWHLPGNLTAGPGWLPVAAGTALAIAALLLNRWHSQLEYAALIFSTFVLAYVLCMLVRDLVTHHGRPTELLKSALAIWSMNILVSASWYWQHHPQVSEVLDCPITAVNKDRVTLTLRVWYRDISTASDVGHALLEQSAKLVGANASTADPMGEKD